MDNTVYPEASLDLVETKKEIYTVTKAEKTRNIGRKVLSIVKGNLLLIATIISVLLGIGIAFILRAFTNLRPDEKEYFGFPGDLFLRMLKFLILPLITSSLITGIAGMGTSKAGRVAARALVYYFATTISAVILGLILVSTIRPGKRAQIDVTSDEFVDPLANQKVSTVDTILDLIRNLFPDNMVEMTFQQYQTRLTAVYHKPVERNITILNETTNETMTTLGNVSDLYYYKSTGITRPGLNVLGLVLFCIVFGAVIGRLGEKTAILVKFFEAMNDASIQMIHIVMIFSPIGICSLICVAVLKMDRPEVVFQQISYYMLTVLVGLAIHGFIVLPAIFLIVTRSNILKYTYNMIEALLIALATSSSSATLPITFRCIEEKNKIHKMISRFVLPVGATVNMDGTALYEAVAAIFIAQVNGRSLAFVDLVVTSITATLASIGAAGVPSAGLVTMVIVLSALNLPAQQISLIYAVDWFLDRFRTMINVWGDSIGAGVVAHLSRKEIEEFDKKENNENKSANNETIVENGFANKSFDNEFVYTTTF